MTVSGRIGVERVPTRSEAGTVPEEGFVFCCSTTTAKSCPHLRCLDAAAAPGDGSVLWLLAGNTTAPTNLRREAKARGVAPSRLVFAPRRDAGRSIWRGIDGGSVPRHAALNAHTTASDALWAGFPVVTAWCEFRGPGGGKLAEQCLPELMTHSLPEYETLALKLAREPRARGERSRPSSTNRGWMPCLSAQRVQAAGVCCRWWWRSYRPCSGSAIRPRPRWIGSCRFPATGLHLCFPRAG